MGGKRCTHGGRCRSGARAALSLRNLQSRFHHPGSTPKDIITIKEAALGEALHSWPICKQQVELCPGPTWPNVGHIMHQQPGAAGSIHHGPQAGQVAAREDVLPNEV